MSTEIFSLNEVIVWTTIVMTVFILLGIFIGWLIFVSFPVILGG